MWWLMMSLWGWTVAPLTRLKHDGNPSPEFIFSLTRRGKALWTEEDEDSPWEDFIRENEIIADTKTALLELYRRHPRMIARDETAQFTLTFSSLCHFAEQTQSKRLPALLRDLHQLIPGTAVSAARQQQKADLVRLKREIAALSRLRALLAEMPQPPARKPDE